MSCRHGCTLLALLSGLLTTVGCVNCRSCAPPTVAVTCRSQPAPRTPAALPGLQAAQLCAAAGEALEQKGYHAEAIQQFESARQHSPQVRGVARHLAVLYDLQGESARAEAEYTSALQEQPNDATLLNDMGYFHYRHDRLQPAEDWLRKATAADPNCHCAWINLGQVLARQGRLEDSYEAFAHVLRPAEAYSNLGVLLAKQGRTAEARSALQQAQTLDPSLEQPRAFLRALPSAPGLLPPGLTHATPPPPDTSSSPPKTDAPAASAVPSMPTLAPVRVAPPAPRALPATLPHPAPATVITPLPAAPASPPSIVISAPQPRQAPNPATPPVPPVPPTAPAAGSPSAATDDLPVIIHGPIHQASTPRAVPPSAAPAPPTPPAPSPAPPAVPVLQRTSAFLPPAKAEERPPQAVLTDCQAEPEITPP
jgi:Tfp pilus assembly protein PilF